MKRVLVLAIVVAACGKHGGQAKREDAAAARPKDAAAVAAAPADAAPPPKPVPNDVVVGPHAACAVMSDATVRCWGDNADGELGDGTQHAATGVVTPKLRGVKQVVLGDAFACALLDDGSVTCWGQIGFGSAARQLAPAAVPGVNDATRIYAIGDAGCASESTGAFVCWGDIDEAGHVTASGAHRAPTAARGLDHVVALAPHAALHDGGDVSFWGADGRPARAGTTGVVEIGSVDLAACGRLDDGTVECFGPAQPCAGAPPPARPAKPVRPVRGKPGRHKPPAKPVAKPKPAAGPRIDKLAFAPARRLAFDLGLCVVTTAGRLECARPHGTTCSIEAYLPALTNVAEVAGHCARRTDGGVRCWSEASRTRAVTAIRGITAATKLAAAGDRACALTAEHVVVCWMGTAAAEIVSL